MKFGRKNKQDSQERPAPGEVLGEVLGDGPGGEQAQAVAPQSTFDADTTDFDASRYIDLGSLLIPPFEGAEVRMHIDEKTGEIQAVMVMSETSAVEVRAFAAPRDPSEMWADVRRELAADTARRGGTADAVDGPFGPELATQVPVTGDNGEALTQPTRIIGVAGPRWLLRATLLGQAAMDRDAAAMWEELVRGMGVRRGPEAMPAGQALPLQLPPDAMEQMSPGEPGQA